MQTIYFVFLLFVSFLFSETDGQQFTRSNSSQPFFIPNGPPLTTSDWQELMKYYGAFFIVPVVLGILLSVVLAFLNCMTCCCPKCCCAPPCCLDSKLVIAGLYTFGFLVILGGCIAAWYNAPLFTEGVDIIFAGISGVVDDIIEFLKKTKDDISDLASELESELTPAFNGTALNDTSNTIHSKIDETRNQLKQINETIITLEQYYNQVRGELVVIDNAKSNADITYNTPRPSDVPSPQQSDAFEIAEFEKLLDKIDNETDSIDEQVNSAKPTNNPELPPEMKTFPNFTLPFNISALVDKIEFTVNRLLEVTGLSGPINNLNDTLLSSIPFTSGDFEQFSKVVDENGGYYTLAVCVIGASIVLAYIIWYLGLCTLAIIHRVPFCWSSFIIIFLGLAVGVHLLFGSITDSFCYYRNDLIELAANRTLQEARDQDFPASSMKLLEKILEDPLPLFDCKNNETIFEIYNISLWEDLGFADQIESLLNGTSLNIFPNSSSTDQGMQDLYDKQDTYDNITNSYISQLQRDNDNLIAFQQYLIALSASNGCTPPPPCNDPCCSINQCQVSTQNILTWNVQINNTLSNLTSEIAVLRKLLDDLNDLRKDIIDIIKDTLKFPDLDSNVGSSILNALGECSWLGSFWNNIIGVALCEKIGPAVLWVGWSFAAVGIAMIFLTPIIIWSLNMDSGIV
jgi:hypothetical protein